VDSKKKKRKENESCEKDKIYRDGNGRISAAVTNFREKDRESMQIGRRKNIIINNLPTRLSTINNKMPGSRCNCTK